MNLESWERNGWLEKHRTSKQEIQELLSVVERELIYSEAMAGGVEQGEEGEFNHAYEAARTLAKIALTACGYTTSRQQLSHYRVVESLKLTIGLDTSKVQYLQNCRTLRSKSLYDRAGTVSKRDAGELFKFARGLKEIVLNWLKACHPELIIDVL